MAWAVGATRAEGLSAADGQADGSARAGESWIATRADRGTGGSPDRAAASGRRIATRRGQDVAARAVCRRKPVTAWAATRLCLEGASGCG